MRILVRSPNWIGDQVLAYPFFRGLRARHPDARIAALCVPWVEAIQFRGLVDEVIAMPRPANSSLPARFRAIEEASRAARTRGPWDLAYSLPNSFSAAWVLARADAKRRIGFTGDGRSFLLGMPIPWSEGEALHRADAYLRLLGEREAFDGKVFWAGNAFDAAREWPVAARVDPPSSPFYVLAPGATADSRRWPEERFLKLAERIHAETGLVGAVIGGEGERALASRLVSSRKAGLLDFTARGPLPALADLLSGARFTLCNESGLSHVASLLGSPVFIVCGAADPRRTSPIGPGPARVETNPLPCWPCERNVCRFEGEGKNACLRGIEVSRVWESIRRGGFA